MYCDSQANVRWSTLSYRYLLSRRSSSENNIFRCVSSSTSAKEEDRVTEGTYFDWCEKEGCDSGGTENQYILRQKVSTSRRRQAAVNGCADLKLTEANKLKYTLIDCDAKRKPLCLRGDPIINSPRRMKKRRKKHKQRKKDLRMKQIRGKSQWRKMLRNKKRRGRQLSRQEPSPPLEMCATVGRLKNMEKDTLLNINLVKSWLKTVHGKKALSRFSVSQ